ncbi:MAG: hypothetical protein BM556_05580 [Bacteriovorax sp. MedPE-SWde]|nr:MAG: hypothetical protein BM556_05580 [Bacteriovorax sp. MedPE-SWde]
MTPEKLFKCVLDQLEFYVDGSLEKFSDVFEKACRLCRVEVDQGYMSYIYFDFLIMIGVIEKYQRSGRHRWRFNSIIESNENVINTEFESNHGFELFPSREFVSEFIGDTSHWLDVVVSNEFDVSTVCNYLTRQLRSENLEVKYSQKFNFEKNQWSGEEFSYDKYGLYLLGFHKFQRTPTIVSKGVCLSVFDLDYSFLFYFLINKDFSLFEPTEGIIVIPWKIKLPTIVKRILFINSSVVSYQYEGVKFTLNQNDRYLEIMKKIETLEIDWKDIA